MKKSKRFKIKKHDKYNEKKLKDLTYYEDYEIKKIRIQRLQEYGVLSLLGLLGITFIVSGNDNILSEIEMQQNNIMNTAGIGLTATGIIGSVVNVFRNGDRGDELRRLKKRREEILEIYTNSSKRK